MNKYIILALMFLLLPISVSATMPQNYFTSVVEDSPINVYYSVFLQNGVNTLIDLRSTSDLRSSQLEWSVISADLDGYMHTPNNGDTIDLTCFDSPFLQYLDAQPSWHAQGTWINTLQLNSGSSGLSSLSTTEATFTKYSMRCYATIIGDDAWITFTFKAKVENQLMKAFAVSDDATNEIIQRTGHTLTAAFDVIKLVIIAAGLVLLIFIIVFMAKVFMFFVKKLKVRKQ
jgi:hypothetical protein